MKCKKCGNFLQEDNKYCAICGNDITNQKIDLIEDSGKKISGLKVTLFIIIAFLVIISIYYSINDYKSLSVKGNWKCCDYTNDIKLSEDNNYYFGISFLDNNVFLQNSFNNSKDNIQIRGVYSESISDSKIVEKDVKRNFDVYITTETYIKNGERQDNNITTRYLISLLKNDKYALLINNQNYNAYLCERY